MTPVTLMEEAQADGVILTLSAAGTIKASGDGAAVTRWLPTIRGHKAELVDALRAASISGDEDAAISRWLEHIGERDPATIAEVMVQGRGDDDARRYFIGRAAEVQRADAADDRRACQQCRNLPTRVGAAARRGG